MTPKLTDILNIIPVDRQQHIYDSFKFKLHVKIYQTVQYHSRFLQKVEDDYIERSMPSILERFHANERTAFGMLSLEDWISIERGSFQARHGIYSRMRRLESTTLGKLCRVWYNLTRPVRKKLKHWKMRRNLDKVLKDWVE